MTTAPHTDLEAEMALLGCIMREPELLRSLPGITRSSFYTTAHQILFGAMAEMEESGINIDLITLRARLQSASLHDKIGGSEYLGTIWMCVASAANALEYARIVGDMAGRRALAGVGADIAATAADPQQSPAEAVGNAVQKLTEHAESLARPQAVTRIDLAEPTPPVEWIVEGLIQKESFGFLVSSGGVGKSWLTFALARALAAGTPFLGLHVARPHRVVMVDFEMSKREVLRRTALLGTLDPDVRERIFYGQCKCVLPVISEGVQIAQTCLNHRADFCILDPFSYIHEHDEGDNSAMRPVIVALRMLMWRSQASLLVVHHTRKPKDDKRTRESIDEGRGATTLRDGSDYTLSLTRQGPVRILKHTKNKLGAEMSPLDILIQDTEEGIVITASHRRSTAEKNEAAIAAILEALRGANPPQVSAKELERDLGLPHATLHRALLTGLDLGHWEKIGKGMYSLSGQKKQGTPTESPELVQRQMSL